MEEREVPVEQVYEEVANWASSDNKISVKHIKQSQDREMFAISLVGNHENMQILKEVMNNFPEQYQVNNISNDEVATNYEVIMPIQQLSNIAAGGLYFRKMEEMKISSDINRKKLIDNMAKQDSDNEDGDVQEFSSISNIIQDVSQSGLRQF